MPLLRGCCSLDLQIGTKIIGIVFLILNLLGFLTVALIFLTFLVLKEVVVEMAVPILKSAFIVPDQEQEQYEQMDKQGQKMAELLENNTDKIMIVLIVFLSQQLLDLICNSCLIHGIRTNRRGLLVPWIVTHVLYQIMELGFIVLLIVVLVHLNGLYQVILPALAFMLLWMALHLYLILVVISQFQALGLIRMHDEMCMK